MQLIRPGDGPGQCVQQTGAGRRCGNREVDGLEYCLQHMPGDLLDEAEQITGRRRCRTRFGQSDECHQYAVENTDPPACKNHGANIGSKTSVAAAGRTVEGRVTDRMIEIMGEKGDRLLDPGRAPDPLTGLLALADEMHEWKQIMREVVAYLVARGKIRESNGRIGEQVRAEILIYERALERLAQLWEKIIRLGIESRMAQVEDAQVRMVETALSAALTASGLGLVEQEKARQALRRELVKAAG